MVHLSHRPTTLPSPDEALPGRSEPIAAPERHFVSGARIVPPWPEGSERALFAMGCFWGAERRFWETPGVLATAVGYAGGSTPNPSYEEVCTGLTGHAEAVQVVYDPAVVSFEQLVKVFWEGHDPTQGMRQGADIGTQYRSVLFVTDTNQRQAARASLDTYQILLSAAGYGPITTEIVDAPAFYYASAGHQQYLAKNPDGYCGEGGTGVACPVGVGITAASAEPSTGVR